MNQAPSEAEVRAQRKADEERVRARAAELREAGKATAQDAPKEGQARYDETKVRVCVWASVFAASSRLSHALSVVQRFMDDT